MVDDKFQARRKFLQNVHVWFYLLIYLIVLKQAYLVARFKSFKVLDQVLLRLEKDFLCRCVKNVNKIINLVKKPKKFN